MRRRVLSILVENTSGVLSRVSGLFSRRGYNIDSLTVGVTQDHNYSRITVVARGDDQILEQIEKQVAKLIDVKEITRLEEGFSVCRELILIKVSVSEENRQSLLAITEIFRAKIVDVSKETMTIELTGNQSKLDAFINLLDGFTILELVRTGVTGLTRGSIDMGLDFVD